MRTMAMTSTHAKDQGQRSLGSKARVETDRRTDGRTEAIALPPVLTRSATSMGNDRLIQVRPGNTVDNWCVHVLYEWMDGCMHVQEAYNVYRTLGLYSAT